MKAKGLLLLLGTILGIIMAEGAARTFGLSKTWMSYGGRSSTLKASTKSYQVGFRHVAKASAPASYGKVFQANADGFRDRDFILAKPQDKLRIAFVGDSVTEGYGVDPEQRFSCIAGRSLTAHGVPAETLNFGIGGHATVDEYVVLRDYVLRYAPDVIVLQFGWNDIVGNTQTISFLDPGLAAAPAFPAPQGATADKRPWRLKGFFQLHSALYLAVAERVSLLRIRNGGSSPILDNVLATQAEQWDATRRIFDRVFRACRERGVRLIVTYLPLDVEVQTPDAQKAMLTESTVKAICTGQPGVEFVDVMDVLREASREGLFLDDVHLTASGNRLVGEELARALMRPVPVSETGS